MTAPTTPEQGPTKPETPASVAGGARRGAPALAWWRRHCDPMNRQVDPGTRARLRRARSHLDVLRVSAAADLARRLGAVPTTHAAPPWRLYAALDLARVLAHVKEHETRHPMRAAGWKGFPGDKKESEAGDQRPVLSEARFRRLLETGEGEEKVLAFTRLVTILGGMINVEQLASDFITWNHPEYGDRVRERWVFEYLDAGNAAPEPPPIDSPNTENDGE